MNVRHLLSFCSSHLPWLEGINRLLDIQPLLDQQVSLSDFYLDWNWSVLSWPGFVLFVWNVYVVIITVCAYPDWTCVSAILRLLHLFESWTIFRRICSPTSKLTVILVIDCLVGMCNSFWSQSNFSHIFGSKLFWKSPKLYSVLYIFFWLVSEPTRLKTIKSFFFKDTLIEFWIKSIWNFA